MNINSTLIELDRVVNLTHYGKRPANSPIMTKSIQSHTNSDIIIPSPVSYAG